MDNLHKAFLSNIDTLVNQPHKLEEETKLFGTDSDWGTFENVKNFIQSHDVKWKSELLQITTLHIACRFGHISLVRQLVQEGSDVNAKNIADETPLMKAVDFMHPEVVYFLLQNKANVNESDGRNWSPLHDACRSGDSLIVKLLLDCGALVNVQDEFKKQTPLHVAVIEFDSILIVKYLVDDFNADIQIQDEQGKTPFDYAMEEIDNLDDEAINRRMEIANLLKNKLIQEDNDSKPKPVSLKRKKSG